MSTKFWRNSALILGPFLLMATIDVTSWFHVSLHVPNTAPGWRIESYGGDLHLIRLGQPQRIPAFMSTPDFAKLDIELRSEIEAYWEVHGQTETAKPLPTLSGNASVVFSGTRAGGIFLWPGWIGPCWETVIPYWPFVLLTSILPFSALGYAIAHADRYRRPNGLCPRCSYDLRGNTSGICPECGTRRV